MKYFLSAVEADVQAVRDVVNAHHSAPVGDALYTGYVSSGPRGSNFICMVPPEDEQHLSASQQAALSTVGQLPPL